jgi:SpoVK/Ycf46/Vps4 family AAA+-type ATPase
MEEDPICLDDILNVIDGIKETPGRILIISSNHYDKLDSALVRPGRIDITMKMKNASRNTIQDMYKHYYKKAIPTKALAKIKDDHYSPAEVINTYILNKHNPETFIQELTKKRTK